MCDVSKVDIRGSNFQNIFSRSN